MKNKLVILLFLLTFPSVFYVVLTTGKANFIHLPYFGEKILASNGKDTIYHSIPSFKLINQNGDTITDKMFSSKIYIASYFYTDCNTITCQKIITELLRVSEKFLYTSDNVKILSFTMKPETDSVVTLKTFFKTVHADDKIWSFVTGDKKQLYDLARNGYMLNSAKGEIQPTDSLHNERLVLIDKEKHIRGFYDGTNIKEVNNLLDDVKVLIAEYFIKENKKVKADEKNR